MSDDASRANAPGGRRGDRPEQQRSSSSWFSRDHLDDHGWAAEAPAADSAADDVAGRVADPPRDETHARDTVGRGSLSGSGSVPAVPPADTTHSTSTGSATTTTGETPRRTTEQRYAAAVNAMNQVISNQDPSALPWIIEVFRTTAGMLADTDPARAAVLNNLGTAAQLTFATSSDIADLEDALGYYRNAVNTAGQHDEDLVLYRSNLVLACTDYALRTRDSGTSAQAVEHARETARITPPNDHRQHMALVRLANALRAHTRVSGDTEADDESIEVFRAAIRTAPDGSTGELLVNLGAALSRRHERTGAAEPLDEGVRCLVTGVNALPEGTSRHRALCYYAVALRLRFHTSGDLSDLSTGITELLNVVSSAPDSHPLRGRSAQHLAECTVDYIDATGEPQPLRHVLRPIAEALRVMRGRDTYRDQVLTLYGALLRRHYQHHAEETALTTAVTVGEDAVRHVPEQRRDATIRSLIRTLLTRYEHAGDRADLDRAVELAAHLTTQPVPADSALERTADPVSDGQTTTPAQITAALHTALLGILAGQGARHSEQPTDLDAAVQRLAQGLGGIPDTLPARVDTTLHLGRALRRPTQRAGRRRNYRWSRKVLSEAADQTTAPADQRVRAAEMAGRFAAQAERWGDAATSLRTAVELLPLVPRGKRVVASPAVQQHWASLTADAAACVIESGEPQRAVEVLEHGRSAVLTDFLPSGGELGRLHRTHPELADQAVRLRRLLDRPTAEPALAPIDDRGQLASSWETLLEQVRAADPGHLRPASFDELATAAQYGNDHGTLVLLNVSRYRSDALIVFGEHVVTVPLTGVTPEIIAERAHAALNAALNRDEPSLRACLRWTWDRLVRPVLDRMGYVRTPEAGQRWPRVWWCTQGAAAYLPLHAATSADGTSALERVVSSYTPTMRTLLRARNRQRGHTPDKLVAAGSTEHVTRELPHRNQVVARHWPYAEVASSETTSAPDMLGQLSQHAWLHVCERSVAHPAQPAAASVLTRDPEPSLGVVEVGQVPLHGAELCTLARCATVPQEPSTAAITLPDALGFAGYAHVLGSLWEVDEHSIGAALDGVYGEIVDGEADHAGYALHDAARRLRAQFPEEPTRWAGFRHVGP